MSGRVQELILARHGESEYSVRGALNSDPSVAVDLTQEGVQQARHLGELLKDETIDLCLTTEFARTKQTADLALERRPDVPRETVPELNDIEVGGFEGDQVEAYREWLKDNGPSATPPGGGESRFGSILRYCAAFRRLLSRPERRILLVAHGLPIKCLLLASQEEDIPLVMEQPDYATPFRLSADQVQLAVERLEAWASRPAPA